MSGVNESGASKDPLHPVRLLKLIFLLLLALVALVGGTWWTARRISERDRTAWKGPALQRLSALSATNETIRAELDELKTGTNVYSRWANDHVLLMTNGEFIAYQYRHGANVYFPPHLFLGHSSDGRWLYSSYHFCNFMTMVAGHDPPGSIAEFEKTYSAREFDGKSDQCLKITQ